ncbi:elongation factor P [Tuwongella immobilis]|uniref:Elongation factor P n=1 Tax=Tuwongella immobilis TaxID=692036 RepID=A0A6C2YSU2_9BACT|nr:elongation factor P [Tuwongella immobilis]VIP04798.1 elongation factor p : Elongation factor P OS=Candidatus Kuenenia stuttgartiensis GN=efp PE=3 SV=1: EFP_N: EFP: Elong-fact-P_C [Tuwongella immobilis]VTS06956.1 elongation factor p : Elongation factor P OS=Candidatus Kuenenia stuttgartiensis GN=efp PE=3 SV=1: EFP_N: EFP: Elong-fact-P_C [Tuwongella immobilis]
MASIKFIDVRKGMVLVLEDKQLYQCLDRDLNTPGNWRAILQLKLKNLKTESITMQRVRPDDKVELAYLETKDMNYSYRDGNEFIFVENETFEQYTLPEELVGEQIGYLKENDPCKVTFYEGKALSLELPQIVELKVIETDPGIKGATAAAQYKPATLETGIKVTVPMFINIGEGVRVDTTTGEYVGRVTAEK